MTVQGLCKRTQAEQEEHPVDVLPPNRNPCERSLANQSDDEREPSILDVDRRPSVPSTVTFPDAGRNVATNGRWRCR